MNLYQKNRPQTFDAMIGNEAQIASLKKMLAKQDKPHVYLFTGPPGCGKTTAARIAARELGAGELSIKEINSANNRGIETAREIIDQVRYSPVDGKVTVYIIDEMHMTTKDWQNAMLKTLEDTPEHAYFFLCTTDPQKLAAALKTRCTEVKFNALKPDESLLLLKTVNRAESLGISKEILQEIADVCEGSPRRALVILEKVAALETVEEQHKLIASGVPDEENAETIELCRVLIKDKVSWKEALEIVSKLNMDNAENIRQAVIGYMKAVLRKTWNPHAMIVLESFAERDFFYDAEARLFVALGHVIFPDTPF
jgi:DNA polymerase III gamma/tau subunit